MAARPSETIWLSFLLRVRTFAGSAGGSWLWRGEDGAAVSLEGRVVVFVSPTIVETALRASMASAMSVSLTDSAAPYSARNYSRRYGCTRHVVSRSL
jgi:hypothetical protein